LEFYRQLGLASAVIENGIKVDSLRWRLDQQEVASLPIGDFGTGLSPYPFILSFPQDDHEQLLGAELAALGVTIEWNTELVRFHDDGDKVHATLCQSGSESTLSVAYLCGCDGARSTVREGLGLDFPGGTYEHLFYVADVTAHGQATEGGFNLCLGKDDFCAVMPVRRNGLQRLIGIMPDQPTSPNFESVRPVVERQTGLQVETVHWFSTYRVHHRVAERFRVGRVFIAGDAGHIHSPAGGQGMNTGIGDAVNLAWKLAEVLQQRANPKLLDSYEPERIAFARVLVKTNDQMFQRVANRKLRGQVFRTVLLPYVLPFVMGFTAVRKRAFSVMSQTRIHYRDSAFNRGTAGKLRGGDRLPWLAHADNFAPLATLDWQLHVYGTASAALRAAAHNTGLALEEFSWSSEAHTAGFARDALYLVRPDGHLGLVDPEQNIDALFSYMGEWRQVPENV